MRRDNKRVLLVALFLCLCCSSVAVANPFLGTSEQQKATPVRSSKPSDELSGIQRRVQQMLGNAFHDYKKGMVPLGTIAIFAFLYGMIHGAGPGHRKTVVFSLYLTRDAPIWEPAVSGALLAFLHGGLSVALLCIFQISAGALSVRAESASLWLEGCSYVALIVIAFCMALGAVSRLVRFVRGNAELVNKTSVPRKTKTTKSLGALFITGLYPCPGAILVLILSLSLDMIAAGIAAVCAMSVGMCVPIVICGYLAWFGRTGLFKKIQQHENQVQKTAAAVESVGWLFLLVFAVYTATPFIAGVCHRLVS